MKFSCEKQPLIDAVTNVQRAVSGKSSLPALEGILLKASGNSVFIVGYDMELGITTTIDATISQPGDIVLTARLFGDIVRKLPDDIVEITSDDKWNTTIHCGQSEFTIIGISPSEYPEIPTVNDGATITLPQNTLKSMIRQTIFAISQNDTRPVHTGTLFEVEPEVLRLVSVDGSRLAMRSEPIKEQQSMHFVVPGKTLNEVLKLLSDEDTALTLSVGKRHVVLEINNYAVISRLLDGEFLAYRKAIPDEVSTSILVNTRTLMDAVERASLVINDRVKSPLVCKFDENSISISCFTALGSANDRIPAKIEGKVEEMGFNSRYLLDALKNAETDEVRIELNGPLSPMRIKPTDGDNYLFLVLPVRLKNI